MTMDYLTLGSTPSNEPCAQVGSRQYDQAARIEGIAYKDQIRRQFPQLDDEDVNFSINIQRKGFPHDFGTYHEVCAVYDVDNEAAIRLAFQIDEELPTEWDKEAVKYLADNGYYSLMGFDVPDQIMQ